MIQKSIVLCKIIENKKIWNRLTKYVPFCIVLNLPTLLEI